MDIILKVEGPIENFKIEGLNRPIKFGNQTYNLTFFLKIIEPK